MKFQGTKGPTDGVIATMPLVAHETLVLGKPPPDFLTEDPDAALFRRLDSLDRSPVQCLGPGEHLIAVYGDNFMSKSKYKLRAVPMVSGTPEVESITEVEAEIRERKTELAAFEKVLSQTERVRSRPDAPCVPCACRNFTLHVVLSLLRRSATKRKKRAFAPPSK